MKRLGLSCLYVTPLPQQFLELQVLELHLTVKPLPDLIQYLSHTPTIVELILPRRPEHKEQNQFLTQMAQSESSSAAGLLLPQLRTLVMAFDEGSDTQLISELIQVRNLDRQSGDEEDKGRGSNVDSPMTIYYFQEANFGKRVQNEETTKKLEALRQLYTRTFLPYVAPRDPFDNTQWSESLF